MLAKLGRLMLARLQPRDLTPEERRRSRSANEHQETFEWWILLFQRDRESTRQVFGALLAKDLDPESKIKMCQGKDEARTSKLCHFF